MREVKFPLPVSKFIVPSILSADFSCLIKEIKKVERYSGWIQVDIMDGHFVENLSFGPHIVSCVRRITNLPIDVHLMVNRPVMFVKSFVECGADLITVHYESKDFLKAIHLIKGFGKKVGLALKPKTCFSKLVPYLKLVDLVLIMTVEPGFGGQNFIFDMLDKIKQARDYITEKHLNIYIQVDGGINEKTILYALNSGANSFVMGSALFKEKNPLFIKRIYNMISGL